MGLFDFLKTTVKGPKKPPGGGARKQRGTALISFDGKSFPLAAITSKGFATSSFDDSLIAGQKARITVSVDDPYGRFTFSTNVVITEADGTKCVGAWMMITPDLEAVLRQYSQNKKAAKK